MRILNRITVSFIIFIFLFIFTYIVYALIDYNDQYFVARTIPRYPHASSIKIHSDGFYVPYTEINMETNDTPEQVVSYYKQELPKHGWKLAMEYDVYKESPEYWKQFSNRPTRIVYTKEIWGRKFKLLHITGTSVNNDTYKRLEILNDKDK